MKTRTAIAVVLTLASAGVLVVAIEHSTDHPQVATPMAAVRSAPSAGSQETTPAGAPNAQTAADRAKQVETALATLDQTGPEARIYAALHQEFPEKYGQIVARMRETMLAGTAPIDLDPGLSTMAQSTMLEIRGMVPQSSDASLRKIAAAQYALLGALENESPKACVAYVSGSGMTDVPDEPTIQDIAALLSVAQIRAAGDAVRSPVKRAPPTREMYVTLAQRMHAGGASEEQIAAMADGQMSSLTPADECRLVRTMYHATLNMTENDAGAILASLSNH